MLTCSMLRFFLVCLNDRERLMRVVCFHGRREIDGGDIFLLAARVFGEAATRAGFSTQVRTPGFPSPAGSPDRAVVKVSKSPLADLAIPRSYDLEIVCDPRLAVVPPMGNAVKKSGGVLVLNTPNAIKAPDVRLASVDIDAIASRHSAVPVAAHLGAALSAWEALQGQISPQHIIEGYRAIRGEPMCKAEDKALAEATSAARRALALEGLL